MPGNLQLSKDSTYSGAQAYKNSKLCNILMTYYMAEKLKSTELTINAVDPGQVPTTHLSRNSSKLQRGFQICCLHNVLRRCTKFTRTARHAARQVADIAISDRYAGRNGKYFVDGVDDRSSVESYDRDIQKEVWTMSCKLVGVDYSQDEDFDDISLSSVHERQQLI